MAAVLLRPDPAVKSDEADSAGNIIDAKPDAAATSDAAVIPIRRQSTDSETVANKSLPEAADPIASFDTPPSSLSGKTFATFNNLRAQGVLNLPDMHLDIHVYSDQPADRFVFINMSKYKERAMLTEGPIVKEITPEGVILEYGGTDFLLPRE